MFKFLKKAHSELDFQKRKVHHEANPPIQTSSCKEFEAPNSQAVHITIKNDKILPDILLCLKENKIDYEITTDHEKSRTDGHYLEEVVDLNLKVDTGFKRILLAKNNDHSATTDLKRARRLQDLVVSLEASLHILYVLLEDVRYIHTERWTIMKNYIKESLGTFIFNISPNSESFNKLYQYDEIKSLYSHLTTEYEYLKSTFEKMRLDVVKYKCIPLAEEMNSIRSQFKNFESIYNAFLNKITDDNIESKWKEKWKIELEQIIQEEAELKSILEYKTHVQEDYDEMVKVWNTLEKIILLRRTPSHRQIPDYDTIVIKHDQISKGSELKGLLMDEIKMIYPNHEARFLAIEESLSKHKNNKEKLKNHKNEEDVLFDFKMELLKFISSNKFRDTGGIKRVENELQNKQHAWLFSFFEDTVTH